MSLESTIELVLVSVGGAAGVGFLGRFAITALKRQGLADATLDSHTSALKNCQAEAAKWEQRYNEAQSNHTENIMLIGELRVQNRMLRIIILNKGLMTAEELDSALEIKDGH